MTDPLAATTPATLAERVKADGVEFLLATFVDMNGKPCAKLVPVQALDELEAGALGFAGFAAGAIGQVPSDPDLIAMPDPSSYTNLDFIRPGLALVHCDPYVDGEPWPYAPRVILKNLLAELDSEGITAMVGAEVEYFLLKKDADGTLVTADARDTSGRPCYDARGVTRMFGHLASISKAMNSLGWDNYANDHEDGAGQFEQNFKYSDALQTADRVVTLRYIISMLAEEADMTATFMPKPFTDRTGNGMHMHISLWKGDQALFPAEDDARGLGLSPLAYSFVSGVLEHAAGLSAFLAPTVNSYKRRGAVTTESGATWSPTTAGYGGNDRSHFIRVPDGNRIELRGGDGSANPYLAIATTLAAGFSGVRADADPGDPGKKGVPQPGAAALPPTLLHAVDALRADPVLIDALGLDGRVAEYYAGVKQDEFFRWHNTVTSWEVDNYLTAV
ncbi:type III glutamate--ammonia ligase [Amnibacterium flavum]|uniref:Type III glutamate--ammonia ligase n=1 Tax=Amnibacterium flavum TaxID=2173173 RepID=A0A2V1HW53_9MICO|nr:type III glutamate--ammonia ligase [Amnibacterium flavum]PVZ95320.1 type III glutamate--ammonia ligase [Amnibacterium flavum]